MENCWKRMLVIVGVILTIITAYNLCVLFLSSPQIHSYSVDNMTVQIHSKNFLFFIREARYFTEGVYEKKQVTFSLGSRDLVWLYDENGQFVDYFSYT